jgi:hypothetical protein
MFLALATIRHVAVARAVIRWLRWRKDDIPPSAVVEELASWY